MIWRRSGWVWITEHDGMTVIRTAYYGAAELRDENAEAEKATHGRRFGDWVRVALSLPGLGEPVEPHQLRPWQHSREAFAHGAAL
jgi:hypothetical protein